ncbi:hypothetical protein [Butyrivibrio sp. INlla16]|uniref:hypothetical protein n=1 Tax=Butyrivibrio sp. INlla16 TaxID=1520807 RepID=UPI00088133D7|nr:hypothetical protein [Butyrivibrio sp. INlla16]SDB66646.1 hypothetical protein SAMN02910263_03866 [Butyrivibrio sp. INlla16]
MGSGFKCFCDKCGYSFDAMFGIGMMGFMVREKETKKMRAGKYGEQGKRFFMEHPDGSVTTNYVVVKCTSCGEFHNVYDFDLQIPEPKMEKSKQNLKEALDRGDPEACKLPKEHVERILNRTYYVTKEKYEHKCKKCGGKAEIVENFENLVQAGKIDCPRCENRLSTSDYILWD